MNYDRAISEAIFAYLGAQQMTLAELARDSGISERTLLRRLKFGLWSVNESLDVAHGLHITLTELATAAEQLQAEHEEAL